MAGLILLLAAVLPTALARQYAIYNGFDTLGNDLTSYGDGDDDGNGGVITIANPSTCAGYCDTTDSCLGYVHVMYANMAQRCYMKGSAAIEVGRYSEGRTYQSGFRSTCAATNPSAPTIAQPWCGDAGGMAVYRHFGNNNAAMLAYSTTKTQTKDQCRDACFADSNCDAYVVQNPPRNTVNQDLNDPMGTPNRYFCYMMLKGQTDPTTLVRYASPSGSAVSDTWTLGIVDTCSSNLDANGGTVTPYQTGLCQDFTVAAAPSPATGGTEEGDPTNSPAPAPATSNYVYRKKRRAEMRRRYQQQTLCLSTEVACPADNSLGFECIDTKTDLTSCGGCASDGTGVACEALPGVQYAGCEAGQCIALTCEAGFVLDDGRCV